MRFWFWTDTKKRILLCTTFMKCIKMTPNVTFPYLKTTPQNKSIFWKWSLCNLGNQHSQVKNDQPPIASNFFQLTPSHWKVSWGRFFRRDVRLSRYLLGMNLMLELPRCVSTFREELQLTCRMIKCVDTRQTLRALEAVD